jgi:signal-transduction protein with cAMP-binding, CBS, and nucleotidyltransferase domain
MRPAPPTLRPGATIRDAVTRLTEQRASVLLVIDAGGKPLGILSADDIVRRAIWRADPDESVETIMSRPVVKASAGDYLFRAIAQMRERKLQRLPVADDQGCLVGLLTLADALFALAGPALQLIDVLTGEESIEGWRRAKAAQIDLAEGLLAGAVPVSEIQALLTEINANLHARILAHAVAELEADGWGPPPVSYALIVMGSGGRGENFLAPDQDNGLIIADYADADSARIDGYFLELARRLTSRLDRVGFDLCKGYVMAVNPVWRKRLSEWREQVETWIRRRAPSHLLQADILFDFRHVAGDASLTRALRDFVTSEVSRNPRFVRDLFGIESDHRVALGWFGSLSKEEGEDHRPGMINLKMRGTLPLVEAARLLALKAGISSTSTRARLDALRAKGVIEPADCDYLIGAYNHIARLLLRNQIEDCHAGRPMTDYVAEASLGKRDKDYLVTCFRAIDALRGKLSEEVSV